MIVNGQFSVNGVVSDFEIKVRCAPAPSGGMNGGYLTVRGATGNFGRPLPEAAYDRLREAVQDVLDDELGGDEQIAERASRIAQEQRESPPIYIAPHDVTPKDD